MASEISAPPGFGARLEGVVRLASGPLDGLYHQFWAHPHLGALLSDYYPYLYDFMVASVALFVAARDRSRVLASDCPVARVLAEYFTKHVNEEQGHPDWLVQDMEALGLNRPGDRRVVYSPHVAALVGSQLYWVRHAHPVAVLGYVLLFEGNPPQIAVLDRAVHAGVPRIALRAFYRHATIDLAHGAEVRALLDSLPLTDAHRRLLTASTIASVDHMTQWMLWVLEPSRLSAVQEADVFQAGGSKT